MKFVPVFLITSPSMAPNITRQTSATSFVDLYAALDGKVWICSDAFLNCSSVDEAAYSPIETVYFDKGTLRYKSTEGDLKEDDFILQSLVMWNLYRMDMGLGVPTMLRQLSIWGGKQQDTDIRAKNLWISEITPRSVGKGLNHVDSFGNFHHFCPPGNGCSKWRRRSHTKNNMVHILAEQSVVQWALEWKTCKHHNPSLYRELGAAVIRIQASCTDRKQAAELPSVLFREATKSNGDGSFCRKAFRAIELELAD